MDIFITKFFPKIGIVDFSDIKIEATIKQRVFNISLIILKEEINRLIKGLLNKKALRPNNILNKVLKIIALVIAKDLAKAASYYFTNKTIPESLKESIIVILHKDGKKDYSLLSSYKLIALKNTLAKVLKKYVANIISKAVKKYKLLP